MSNQIKFNVGFNVNGSDLNALKSSLQDIKKLTNDAFVKTNGNKFGNVTKELAQIRSTAGAVEDALSKAFNPKLNTINITSFNNELKKSDLTIEQIYKDFSKAGTAGQVGFQRLATTVLTTNTELKRTQTILDKMGETLGNTIKWNIASGAVNKLTGSVQEAYGYVKALDGSLNDIQIVTGKSAESMAVFAKNANDAAKKLGTTTTNYTKSALTFYQQGLNDTEVQARAELANKVSNVTGLSGDQAAEYVTAVLNGYKVGSEEAEAAMDKLTAVAASTASDLAELSEGMSKVASAGHAMGVTEDQLAATLSTVISVTRQSAATVGTAFKTIYARISDIEAGTEDAEMSLGIYTEKMKEMGFNVLDSSDHLRDMGEVMEEIGNSWHTLSREQQVSLAQTMAGTRQYNNLIALFDNWDNYIKSLNVSMKANGTLQEQQNTYMESTKAHLNQLKAASEDVFDSFLDPDTINTFADGISRILSLLADQIDALGGGTNTLLSISSSALAIFNKQITQSLIGMVGNIRNAKINAEDLKTQMQLIPEFKAIDDNVINQIVEMKKTVLDYGDIVSAEQQSEADGYIKQKAALLEKKTEIEKNIDAAKEYLKIMQAAGVDVDTDAFNSFDKNLKVQNDKNGNVGGRKTKSQNRADKIMEIHDQAFDDLNVEIDFAESHIEELEKAFIKMWKASTGDSDEAALAAQKVGAAEENLKDNLKNTIKYLNKKSETYKNLIKILKEVQTAQNPIVGEKGEIDIDALTEADFKNEKQAASFIKTFKKAQIEIRGEAEQTRAVMRDSYEGVFQEVDAEIQQVESIWDRFLKKLDTGKIIQNFTLVTSAIGQVTSSIYTLQNIGSIWNDEDLTSGEKLLQTIMALSSAAPMLVAGLGSLNKVLKLVVVGETAASLAQKGYTVATNSATGATIALNTALLKNPLTWAIAAVIGAVAAAYGVYSHNVKKAAEAKEELDASIDNSLALQQEADNVNNLYTAYKKLYDNYSRTGEGQEDLYQSTIDLAEAFDVQISTLDLLAGRYDTINSKILEARANQAKLALDEAKEGMKNVGKRMSMDSSSANKMDPSRRDIVFDTGSLYNEEEDQKAAEYLSKYLDFDFIGGGSIWSSTISVLGVAENDMMEAYKQIQLAYNKMTSELNSETLKDSELYGSIEKWLDDNKDYYDKYTELQNSLTSRAQEFAEAQAALTATDLKIEDIDSFEDYKKYKSDYIEQLRSALGGDENIVYDENLYSSTDEYLSYLTNHYFEAIDSIKKYTQDSSMADEVKRALLGGLGKGATQEDKDKVEAYVNDLTDGDLQLIATIGINETASQETIDKTIDYAKKKAINEISELPMEAINKVLELSNKDKLTQNEQKDYNNANSEVNSYMEAHGIKDQWDIASQRGALIQAEFLQDLASKNNQYAKQTMENIRQELEAQELLEEQKKSDIETSIKNDYNVENDNELRDRISEYEKALDNLDKESAEKIFGSEDSYKNAKKQIDAIDDINSAIIELDSTLKKGGFADFANAFNTDEILSVGDTILEQSEKIQKASELIGEGFLVAAEDADTLAKVFPEIMANAEVASDGIIHLDEETVEELLGGQQEILNGDINTAVAKIDNQIKTLQTKKEAAQAELDIANAVARSEVGIAEEQTKILTNGRKQLTDYLIQLGADEANAEQAVAAAMAGNMEEYDRITAGVSNNTARNLALAMSEAANAAQNNSASMVTSISAVGTQAKIVAKQIKGMANGVVVEGGPVAVGGGGTGGSNFNANSFNGNFSGVTPGSASSSDINIGGWQDQLLGEIAGYDQAIANLEALKAKLLASQKNANSALSGAMSGSGGKPSHGGGGSSNKDKKADQLDLLKDELDVYHDIDIQIQNIERDISKLEKQEEFLTGQDLINNLTKQLELLQKQKEAYADKIELAKMESNALKSALETYGATFDKQTGEITNYYDLLNHQLEKTNSIIAAYNNLSSEAQTDEEKQKVESAKAAYEQLKNLIANYEKIIFDTIPGLQEQIEDSLSREIEIQIQEFDMKLQLRLDMSAAQRDWNEFKRKVIDGISDDDLTGSANQGYKDWLSYYNTDGKGNGSIQAQTDRVNQILQDLNNMKNGGHSSVYSAYDANTGTWVDDIARAEEDLKKASESLMQDLSDIVDLENNMKESFLDSIDAVQNAFDKQKAGFDFVGEQIEHDIKMMELLYGDKATKKLDGYYQNQIKNTKAEMQAQMQAKAYWKDKMDAERAAIEAGEGSKEAFEKYEENWKASVSNVNSLLENWIDQVTAKYENTISNIIDSLNDKLSNGSGLDYLNEELSLLNDNAGNYLDTINASYAIQDLSNKWQNAINNTDNIESQEQLNSLMQQQLDMLESKGKLTQYDIDRAEKEYEIALKQIALQEAQHNKSKMRLRRDSNGNYSYQFVSDEENIRKAEEELAAAKNELYNFDKSAYQNNLNDMYSVWNEFQQKVAEAYQKYAGDQDALNEHIALLQKEYGEKINYLTEQNLNIRNNLTSSAIEGLSDIYGIDVENFQAMTDAEKNLILNDLIPQWDSGVQQMIDKFAGEGGFEQVCQDVFDQLGQAARDYQDELDNIRDKNEQASQEVHDQSEQILADNNKLLDAAKAELERINDILQKVQELQRAYKDAKEEAIAATAAAYQYAQVASIIVPTKEELEQKTKDELQRQRDEAEAAARAEIESQIKNSQSGNKDNDNSGGSATDPSARRPGETLTEWRDRIQAQKTARFATGGYTGSWGNEGRLAILDQKELVLNADDTKNMLSAISLLRHLVNEIGTNALDNVRSKLSGLNITNVNTNSPESFEQKVYIEAKFEGQTEASQIETALNNLVNTATQRMYHNRK